MSFAGSLFQFFSGRATPRPFSPPPDVENRQAAPSPGMRIEPTSGSFPSGTPRFAPPEPASNALPRNMFGDQIPNAAPSQLRDVNPDSTSARGVRVYRQGER